MILNVVNFDIEGLKLFNIKSFKDNRGSFSEVFLSNIDIPEIKKKYVQENESISNYGVFRGMHFQKGKNSQSKLIRVVKGRVIDVICDLRKSSSTFKKSISLELFPNQMIFIPKGFAHGFLSLEEETILNYKSDNYYNYKSEAGFNLFDSDLNIKFPLKLEDITISEKDRLLPNLDNSYIYRNL